MVKLPALLFISSLLHCGEAKTPETKPAAVTPAEVKPAEVKPAEITPAPEVHDYERCKSPARAYPKWCSEIEKSRVTSR